MDIPGIQELQFYTLFYDFIFYSFLGWILETCYASFTTRGFVNRGFLNGPFCPVYGFGAVLIVCVLTPVRNDAFLLFILGTFLTSLLEYITGYILEKAFHTKWWDYSQRRFHLHGRICLPFSILWGILSVVLLQTLHPATCYLITLIPVPAGKVILFFLAGYFILDVAFSAGTVLRLNHRLKQIHLLSEEISARLGYVKRLSLPASIEELQRKVLELTLRREKLVNRKMVFHTRLLKAFPGIQSLGFDKTLKEIKSRIRALQKKGKD